MILMKKQLSTDEIQENISKIMDFLEGAKRKWDTENPQSKSWFGQNKLYLVKTTIFLLSATDQMIQFVETFIPKGSEKKIAVITVASQLFDHIASKAFPIWVVPFTPIIKQIVISIIISNLIEFIVAKYKAGYWKLEDENESGNKLGSGNNT